MPELSGWGNYPKVAAETIQIARFPELRLPTTSAITQGAARSYGDSALAEKVICTQRLNHFHHFDAERGILHCDAGVLLADILTTFVPKGWFLPVTPGTKFVSVGGAIASDVHGKNHHKQGCFSEFVQSLTLQIGEQILECSRQSHPELFLATCGGMGLTGVITDARIQLQPVTSSYIQQTLIKSPNLVEALSLFEQHNNADYSVAWIDCLAKGENLGRSLLMLGEHANVGELQAHRAGRLTVPCHLPAWCLNAWSIRAFNSAYFHRCSNTPQSSSLHYDPYFYPLDSIQHWNRLYGKKGFTQYQCVLPKAAGIEGLTEILTQISALGQGSFLAVLKAFGEQNQNYLSFPMSGYTLALDFKINAQVFALLDQLDIIVQRYGGRLYLAKDARMSERMFKATYPQWEKFQAIRERYGALALYQSMQSKRIGL